MRIIDVLNKKGHGYHRIVADELLEVAVNKIVRHGVGSLVVTADDDTLVGLVTERSIVESLARNGGSAINETVRSVMLAPPPLCEPDDNVRDAMLLMTSRRTRHLIVVAGSGTMGIVSLGDLVKYRLQDTELENLVLRDMVGANQLLATPSGPSHSTSMRRG